MCGAGQLKSPGLCALSGCCSERFVLPAHLPLHTRQTLLSRVPALCWGQGGRLSACPLGDLPHHPASYDHRPLVLTASQGSRPLGLRLQPGGLPCHLALSWGEGMEVAIAVGRHAPGLPATLPGDTEGKGLFASKRRTIPMGEALTRRPPQCPLAAGISTKEAFSLQLGISKFSPLRRPDEFGAVCHDSAVRRGLALFIRSLSTW